MLQFLLSAQNSTHIQTLVKHPSFVPNKDAFWNERVFTRLVWHYQKEGPQQKILNAIGGKTTYYKSFNGLSWKFNIKYFPELDNSDTFFVANNCTSLQAWKRNNVLVAFRQLSYHSKCWLTDGRTMVYNWKSRLLRTFKNEINPLYFNFVYYLVF